MNGIELRVGDIVEIDNPNSWPALKGVPLKVTGISLKEDKLFHKSNCSISLESDDRINSYSQFNEFIKPIPLTEEWLLKFGFENEFGIYKMIL